MPAPTIRVGSEGGYLYAHQAPGPATGRGVLVLHEIFGLTPWVKSVADRFGALGYHAVAPDLFRDRIHPAFTPDAAERMMPLVWAMPVADRIDEAAFRAALQGHRSDDVEIAWRLARLGQGLEWVPPVMDDLRRWVKHMRGRADLGTGGRVAAIGFCLGGRLSFHLATVEPELAAAVVFYGAGPREAEVERIQCPVLGLYGEDDEFITKDVPRVAAAMKRFGKTFEHDVYNRTGHAFARPGSKGYREDRAADAWARTDAFLRRFLG